MSSPPAARADGGERDLRRGRSVTHEDVWSQPNPGVRYLRRTTSRPAVVHALIVDLHAPGVRVEATRHEDRWSTVSEFAETGPRYAAAINGGFWSSFAEPYGLQVGGGEAWPEVDLDGETGYFAIRADGRALIHHPDGRLPADHGYRAAVSGIPTLVRRGVVADEAIDVIGAARGRHPRTAVGVSRDGDTVYLVVVDGRRHGSRGMNLYELGDFLAELGAYDALNLDGGGSSAMFLRRAGGVVNAPSGGRWEARLGLGANETPSEGRDPSGGGRRVYVRGVERDVMNHLGVIAPAPEIVSPSASNVLDVPTPELSGTIVLPPRPPLLRIGRLRETLGRAAIPLVIILIGVFIIRMLVVRIRHRRRARERRRIVGSPPETKRDFTRMEPPST